MNRRDVESLETPYVLVTLGLITALFLHIYICDIAEGSHDLASCYRECKDNYVGLTISTDQFGACLRDCKRQYPVEQPRTQSAPKGSLTQAAKEYAAIVSRAWEDRYHIMMDCADVVHCQRLVSEWKIDWNRQKRRPEMQQLKQGMTVNERNNMASIEGKFEGNFSLWDLHKKIYGGVPAGETFLTNIGHTFHELKFIVE
jgi:hypothetical protein